MLNPNDEKFLLKSIKEHHLSAQQVVETFLILKHKLSVNEVERKVSTTIDGWNIFNYIQEPKEIKVLLDSLAKEFDEKFIQRLYLETNDDGDNILHSLCKRENLSSLQHFLEATTKNMKDEKFLVKLLSSKSINGNNFVHVLCSNEIDNLSGLQKIFQTIQRQLGVNAVREVLRVINKDQYNIFMTCCRYQSVQGFIDIVELLSKFLSNTDIKKSLKAQNTKKQNFAQIIANYSDATELKSALMLISTKFKDKNFFENIVCSRDDAELTFLHYLSNQCSSAFLDILQMTELDTSLTEKIFLGPESTNNRILDRVCDDVGTFIDTLEIFMVKHGHAFIANILSAQRDDNETILKVMLYKNEMETSIEILDWLIVNINGEFIQYWFLIPNGQNEHIIHQISFYKSIQQLLPWMTSNLDKDFVVKMVQMESNHKMNFLQILSRYLNDNTSYLNLLETMTQELGKEVMMDLMLERSNQTYKGFTFLLLLTRYNDKTPFIDLLKWLNSEFEKDFLEDLLKAREKNGWNFLHVICRYDTNTSIMDLMKWLFQEFDKPFLVELFEPILGSGWTCFNMLAQYNEDLSFIELFQMLVDEIGKEFVQSILTFDNMTDDEGWTTLMLLSGYNIKCSLVDLMKWMKAQFGKEFLEKQAQAVEKDGWTVLLLRSRCRKEECLELLRFFVEEFDEELLRHLLFAVNDESMTFLHIVCSESDKIYFQSFTDQLDFIPEDMLSLLMQTKDALARTPRTHHFHSVGKQKLNFENESILTESQKKEVEKQDQKDQQHKKLDGDLALKMLFSNPSDGWTYLHELCYDNEHSVIYEALQKSFENEFEKHKINQILTFHDNRYRTFLHILSRNQKANIVELLKLLFQSFDKDMLAKLIMDKDNEKNYFITEITSHLPIVELYQLFLDELDVEFVKKSIKLVKNFEYKDQAQFVDLISFFFKNIGKDFAENFLSTERHGNTKFYKQFGKMTEKSYNFVTTGESSFFKDMFKLWKILNGKTFSWEILAYLQSQFSDVTINEVIIDLVTETDKVNDDNWDCLQMLLKFSELEMKDLQESISAIENEDDKILLKEIMVIKDSTGQTLIERTVQDKSKQVTIQIIESISNELEKVLKAELLKTLEKEGESFAIYSNENEYKIAVFSFLQMMISEIIWTLENSKTVDSSDPQVSLKSFKDQFHSNLVDSEFQKFLSMNNIEQLNA